MTVQPRRNRADHRHRPHAGQRAHTCRKLRYPDHRAVVRALHSAIPARSLNPDSCPGERQEGGDLTMLIAAALLFGLAMLAVISNTGGSIAVSTSGLTVTVNAPQ